MARPICAPRAAQSRCDERDQTPGPRWGYKRDGGRHRQGRAACVAGRMITGEVGAHSAAPPPVIGPLLSRCGTDFVGQRRGLQRGSVPSPRSAVTPIDFSFRGPPGDDHIRALEAPACRGPSSLPYVGFGGAVLVVAVRKLPTGGGRHPPRRCPCRCCQRAICALQVRQRAACPLRRPRDRSLHRL